MKKVAILGTGAYGIALSIMFYQNKNQIVMWTKFKEEKDMLEKERIHKKALPSIVIPKPIEFTSNLEKAITGASVIVLAIPAAFIENTINEMKPFYQNQHIIIATKGFDAEGNFMHEVVSKYISTPHIGILSGPTFAVDMAKCAPSALTLATLEDETWNICKETLENKYLKLQRSTDKLGTELCGAIKNVMAIASGILEGMNYPISTKAMFVTEAALTISSLTLTLGGEQNSIISFAGFGDLLLTCMSDKSRNFTLGKMIGEKRSKAEIQTYIENTTIEGLHTIGSLKKLFERKHIDVPLINQIASIIENPSDADLLISYLLPKENA